MSRWEENPNLTDLAEAAKSSWTGGIVQGSNSCHWIWHGTLRSRQRKGSREHLPRSIRYRPLRTLGAVRGQRPMARYRSSEGNETTYGTASLPRPRGASHEALSRPRPTRHRSHYQRNSRSTTNERKPPMMTKGEAEALAVRIEQEAPTCHVTGLRHWEGLGFEINVHDTVEGGTFVVSDAEDWATRNESNP